MRICSYVLGLALIGLWVCLLFLGRINQWALVALLGLTPVVLILLHNVEQIASITAKLKGTELLVEMKRIKAEVYARADSVRAMGEDIAEALAFSLSKWGRLPDEEDLDAELMNRKNHLTSLLRRIGTKEERIRLICAPIDDMVAFDLAARVGKEVFERFQPADARNRSEVSRNISDILRTSLVGSAAKAVRPLLEEYGLWDSSIQSKILEFEQFRLTHVSEDQKSAVRPEPL